MIRKSTDYIVIHCSATKPNMDVGAAEIRQWHLAKGWSGCGYHLIIRRSGIVETGRPILDVGAHVEGHNSNSIGICLVGGLSAINKSENNFTKEQFKALKEQVLGLTKAYPGSVVLGHRDFPDVHKDCPCFDVGDWLRKEGI